MCRTLRSGYNGHVYGDYDMIKKTRQIVKSNPKILKKSCSEVNNSGISNRWLYYLE